MRSTGEKQYYMLALIEMLFQHLPANIWVGILYDIACLLHASCLKYDFLWRYLDRILFRVSVFHAFGHRWPYSDLQMGRDASDSGIQSATSLRICTSVAYVADYHRCLFTINLQIEHAGHASLGRLAGWLVQCNIHCEERRREALADLKASRHSEAVLSEHWKNQVEVQTCPLKRHAKKHGAAAVDQVLADEPGTEPP
ncbi:hypothetical protein MSAN_00758200 [Mycena sanguinolenta]|uniref:Uncharacterized protein n=1 Tax=Mycena sanguinolenta TaxID=230812 RepID=A0A8H6Z8M7_9AGAR|nr:hypothetical protein MSAN_00758200 [Mycena sanguinolenta]